MIYLHDRGVVRKSDRLMVWILNLGIIAVVALGALVLNSAIL